MTFRLKIYSSQAASKIMKWYLTKKIWAYFLNIKILYFSIKVFIKRQSFSIILGFIIEIRSSNG